MEAGMPLAPKHRRRICAVLENAATNADVTELNFEGHEVGPEEATLVAAAMLTMTAVTSINCLSNPLGEGVRELIQVFEQTPRIRTLCGLEEGVEQIDWSDSGKGPADAVLLASDLKAGRAGAAVTWVSVLSNPIGDGAGALVEAFEQNDRIQTLLGLEEGIEALDLRHRKLDPGQAKLLAAEIRHGRFTATVTSINCLSNPLGEGVHELIQVFEQTPRIRTLCGLAEGVEKVDWIDLRQLPDFGELPVGKGPADILLLAADLKAGRAGAAVTSLLCGNNLGMVGEVDCCRMLTAADAHAGAFKQLCESLQSSRVTEADLSATGIGPISVGYLRDWLRGATVKPRKVDIRHAPIEREDFESLKAVAQPVGCEVLWEPLED
jgi:hypothetical protein